MRIGDGHRAQLRVGSDGLWAWPSRVRLVARGDGDVTHIVKVRVPDWMLGIRLGRAESRRTGRGGVDDVRMTGASGARRGFGEAHRWEMSKPNQCARVVRAPGECGVGRRCPLVKPVSAFTSEEWRSGGGYRPGSSTSHSRPASPFVDRDPECGRNRVE